ncbi:MAG: DUF262 domain-containing protein [Methylococcaceae bacterium]|nr:DUF262 domain-containing protein [Methylococcaceae bacterium]
MMKEVEIEDDTESNGEENNGEYITNPFSTKDIKITNASILLPSLINRLKHEEIGIPEFQRNSDLWTPKVMSRLIESILLKLPLPIFYFDVSDPDKWQVVDGLQRLSAIRRFFVDKDLRLKNLQFLIELNGKNYDDLERNFQRTIDETAFITYQIEAQTPKEVRYSIFNRINTGGTPLNAQEIRQALNQGNGLQFLKEVCENKIFKNIVGVDSKRMLDRELALRFVAFQFIDYQHYNSMREFLDAAMGKLSIQNTEQLEELKNKIFNVLEFSEKILGTGHRFSRSISNKSNTQRLNQSLFDVLTVCFSEIDNKDVFLRKKDIFMNKFKQLLQDEKGEFLNSITLGTSAKSAIETRFRIIRGLIKEVLNEN